VNGHEQALPISCAERAIFHIPKPALTGGRKNHQCQMEEASETAPSMSGKPEPSGKAQAWPASPAPEAPLRVRIVYIVSSRHPSECSLMPNPALAPANAMCEFALLAFARRTLYKAALPRTEVL
jgi:hypothetical protein